MATGEKRLEKKEKIWQHGALSLRKVSSERHTAQPLWDFLAVCRPSHQNLDVWLTFKHLWRDKQSTKSPEGVWWDESDNPSHKPKQQSDRMEKQATLKEKVNRLNTIFDTLSCVLPFLKLLVFYCPPPNNTFNLASRTGNTKWPFLRKPRKRALSIFQSCILHWSAQWMCRLSWHR